MNRVTAVCLALVLLTTTMTGCFSPEADEELIEAGDLMITPDILVGAQFQAVEFSASSSMSVHVPYLVLDPDSGYVVNGTTLDFDGAGTAVLHEHFKTATFTRPDADSGELVTETVKPPEAPRLCDLVSAIRSGTDPAISSREGIRSAVLVECIEASIRTGEAQAVKIPAF